jgi:hypothetical protein
MILSLLALAFAQAADPAAAPSADAAPPAASAPVATTGETPAGAPTDDYGLVAWCRGALAGHMELYKAVKVEMQRVEAEKAARTNAKLSGAALQAAKARQAREAKQSDEEDAAQMKAGREYIQLYGQALDAAEAAAPQSLHVRGQQEIEGGYKIWAAARAANPRDRMWSWLMWELPARCETAAKRLKANAGLFGDAYKAPEPAAAAAAPPSSDAPAPAAAAPAPPPAG